MPEVDGKLVRMALDRDAALLTLDTNLAKVASLAGARVMNLHALALALRPPVGAGDTVTVSLLRPGKEPGQGVGYLDDGTMVVVEEGRPLVGSEVAVDVTSVLTTANGRMVFARRQRPARRGVPPPVVRPAHVTSPGLPDVVGVVLTDPAAAGLLVERAGPDGPSLLAGALPGRRAGRGHRRGRGPAGGAHRRRGVGARPAPSPRRSPGPGPGRPAVDVPRAAGPRPVVPRPTRPTAGGGDRGGAALADHCGGASVTARSRWSAAAS